MIYSFATVTPRTPPTDPARTLGIEVTDPAVAAMCGLGNIDPQHGQHRPLPTWAAPRAGSAAIDFAALGYSAMPDPGASLVTSRPDVDSIGAMAVLVLRALGLLDIGADNLPLILPPEQTTRGRIMLIASLDSFRPAAGAPRPSLPTATQPWSPDGAVGPVDSAPTMKALAVVCSPNRAMKQEEHPLNVRVAIVACWLLWGAPPPSTFDGRSALWFANSGDVDAGVKMSDVCRACDIESTGETLADLYHVAARTADAARLDLARALADGRMTVRVDAPSGERADSATCDTCGSWVELYDQTPIAIVRGLHVGALGVGYSQADVVVAEQVDPRVQDAFAVLDARLLALIDAGEGDSQAADAVRADMDPLWRDGGRPSSHPEARKVTIAWREKGVVDRDALCAALNEAERVAVDAREETGSGSWGGPEALLGSPGGTAPDAGTVLALDEIVRLVRAHITSVS